MPFSPSLLCSSPCCRYLSIMPTHRLYHSTCYLSHLAQCYLLLDTIFCHIFHPFLTQLLFTFLTLSLPFMFIFVMSFSLCFNAHEQTTRTKLNWNYWSPNSSSTGLPTSRNSPVVAPLPLDPAWEPLPPPPNTPTTQSSGLPRHGA